MIWIVQLSEQRRMKIRLQQNCVIALAKGHLPYVSFIPIMLKKHQNVMSSENFAVHIHQSLHTDSDSWWINHAEVMFCDKRQSVSWSLILHSCKSSGSKSSLLGNWKPSDVSFLGNNVTASGAERKLLFVLCLFEMTVYSTKKSVHWVWVLIYLSRRSHKGQEMNGMKTVPVSNKSQASLAGRGSAVVLSSCHVLWLHCITCRFPLGFSAWSGWDLPDMLGL